MLQSFLHHSKHYKTLTFGKHQSSIQTQLFLVYFEINSASVGFDCHCCSGSIANPHLLFLHNQKMLLQEEEEQERKEGKGWLQHEEHAGWWGMMPRASYMLKSQGYKMHWWNFVDYVNNLSFKLLLFIMIVIAQILTMLLTKSDLLPAAFLAQAVEDTRRALFPSICVVVVVVVVV